MQSSLIVILSVLGVTVGHLPAVAASSPAPRIRYTDIAECDDTQCLYRKIPRTEKRRFAKDVCDGFQDRTASSDFDESLKMLCNLVVARNKAAFRKHEPCVGDSDWSIELEQDLLRWITVAESYDTWSHPQKPPMPTSWGSNQSTLHGSYIYDIQFSADLGGTAVPVSYALYFCVANTPQPANVPFFRRYKVDKKIVTAGPMDSLFPAKPILRQVATLTLDSTGDYTWTDIDRSGVSDLLFVVKGPGFRNVGLAGCLHQPSSTDCNLIGERRFFQAAGFGLKPSLRQKGKNAWIEFRDSDQVVATVTYKLSKSALRVVDTKGEFKTQ